MSAILEYCSKADNPNLFSKGEKSYEAGRVAHFQFDAALKVINGTVGASFKQQKYKVTIDLSGDFKINDVNTSCTCANGKAKCSHVVALSIHAYHSISSTDIDCMWKRPAATTVADDTMTLDDLYPKQYIPSCSREPSEEEKASFMSESQKHNIGFKWIFKPDEGPAAHHSRTSQHIVNIEELMLQTEFINGTSAEKKSFITNKLALSDSQIKIIAEDTTGQSSSFNWFKARKYRLTASNFGNVLAAINRNSFPKSLWSSLLGI